MKSSPASVSTPAGTVRPPLFGNLRILCAAALLTALSIVLGKYLAISTPIFRFSLENLPVLMAGIFFGPFIGGAVGAVADLVGCIMVGYTINPIITLGGISIGMISGLVALIARRRGRLHPVAVGIAVGVSHIVGSMIIKSVGMAIFYRTPLGILLWRVPLYVVIGALEGLILVLLTRNKLFMGELSRLLYRKKGGK